MDGQRILSHEAARRAPNVAPDLIEKWLDREQTYKKLIDETRDVGGLVGSGGSAAAEAANAVGRLRHVHVDEITTPEPLRDLDKLFTRTDARVAAIIEQGVADRLYFVSVKVPRIVDSAGELVSPVRERYVPISCSDQHRTPRDRSARAAARASRGSFFSRRPREPTAAPGVARSPTGSDPRPRPVGRAWTVRR